MDPSGRPETGPLARPARQRREKLARQRLREFSHGHAAPLRRFATPSPSVLAAVGNAAPLQIPFGRARTYCYVRVRPILYDCLVNPHRDESGSPLAHSRSAPLAAPLRVAPSNKPEGGVPGSPEGFGPAYPRTRGHGVTFGGGQVPASVIPQEAHEFAILFPKAELQHRLRGKIRPLIIGAAPSWKSSKAPPARSPFRRRMG